MQVLRQRQLQEDGAVATEYALMAACVALAVLPMVEIFGQHVLRFFTNADLLAAL